jgi:outer membrane protein TolC
VNDAMLAPVPPAAINIATWQDALSYLRARSTDLRIAYDEVKRAEGQTRSALAAVLPQINAGGNATHQFLVTNGFPPNNTLGGNVTLVQPLLNIEAWHTIGTAQVNEDAQKLSMDDIKRTLALGVANNIVAVVTAERVAELNRNGFRQALERLDLTRRKAALGAANGLDVVRVQQDVESSRATLVTGDESLRQSREALGISLGIPGQVGVTRDVNIAGLEQSALHVCSIASNLDERADIAAARRKLDAAKRNVTDVYEQFLPTVNLQSTASTSSTTSVVSPTTNLWNIQAVVQVPIWDGGQRYGALRQARALEDEALQQLESLRRTATVQITQARRGVEVAEASLKVAADARALAAEVDRLTQISYREGQATSLDLVVSASALRQADINLALQDFNVVKARILAVMALATCPW